MSARDDSAIMFEAALKGNPYALNRAAALRPCCQTCGGIIYNPYQAVYLWVRNSPHDPGRQVVVCPDCHAQHFGGKEHAQ